MDGDWATLLLHHSDCNVITTKVLVFEDESLVFEDESWRDVRLRSKTSNHKKRFLVKCYWLMLAEQTEVLSSI